MADQVATGSTAAAITRDTTLSTGNWKHALSGGGGSAYAARYDAFSGWIHKLNHHEDAIIVTTGTGSGTSTLKIRAPSGSDFNLSTDGTTGDLSFGGAVIAKVDADYLYGLNGIAAGGTAAANVLRWERFYFDLPGYPNTTTTVSLSFSDKTAGVIGMLMPITSGPQHDARQGPWNLVDYWSGSSAAAWSFTLNRNSGGVDTVQVVYNGGTYAANGHDPGQGVIIALHEP